MSPLNYVTSGDLDHMHEVVFVKRELGKIGIFLEGFCIKITGVYTKPRPFGFDFDCKRPRELLALARSKAALNKDNDDTLEGRFSAGQTHGTGFRQIGSGPRLHLEIAMDGKCNVHIDSHGYVVGPGQYDWNRGLEHGYWDLLSYGIRLISLRSRALATSGMKRVWRCVAGRRAACSGAARGRHRDRRAWRSAC